MPSEADELAVVEEPAGGGVPNDLVPEPVTRTHRVTGFAAALIGVLPTKYQSKAGQYAALIGVIASMVALFAMDEPAVAIGIQALTALGFVEQSRN